MGAGLAIPRELELIRNESIGQEVYLHYRRIQSIPSNIL
jgi:hypothetical protein